MVFMISSVVYLVGCVIYWFWASGELQPWAQQKPALTKSNIQPTYGATPISNIGYVNEGIELKE